MRWRRLLVWAVVASVALAWVVTAVSAWQPPRYEASALVVVGPKEPSDGRIHPIPNAPRGLQEFTTALMVAIDTRPVAKETIRRLGLEISPTELLNNLTVEQVETSQFIRLTYTDTNPERAKEVANTVGQVASERISKTNSPTTDMTATVYEKAKAPEAPVGPKPLRNGLLALVAGLAISAALIAVLAKLTSA